MADSDRAEEYVKIDGHSIRLPNGEVSTLPCVNKELIGSMSKKVNKVYDAIYYEDPGESGGHRSISGLLKDHDAAIKIMASSHKEGEKKMDGYKIAIITAIISSVTSAGFTYVLTKLLTP